MKVFINSHCRRFDLLIFAVLALSMTAVVAAPTDHWRFNRDRIVTGVAGSFKSHMCELVTGCTVSRYKQFETSSEPIEQELRPAVC